MKKLNRKGFTLIELLAVIVILAIILVIAVPSVLGIQKDAKQKTTKDEALMLIKAIETCIAANQDTTSGFITNCNKDNIGTYFSVNDTVKENMNYTLIGTVDTASISEFEYTNNGYTISTTGTQGDTVAKIETGTIANMKNIINNAKFGK